MRAGDDRQAKSRWLKRVMAAFWRKGTAKNNQIGKAEQAAHFAKTVHNVKIVILGWKLAAASLWCAAACRGNLAAPIWMARRNDCQPVIAKGIGGLNHACIFAIMR